MAGDYLQIDCDLPEKPEVQAICDLTGEPLDLVVGRLVMFWRWVDRHASSRTVTGSSAKTLARMAGGDEKFWEDVASLKSWLIIQPDGITIPGWNKRFSNSAKSRIKTAERQRRHRAKHGDNSVTPKRDKSVTGPLSTEETENRTEQKSSVLQKSKVSQNRTSIGETQEAPADHALAGTDLLEISGEEVSRCARLAGELFERSRYGGDDGGMLWKISVLVGRGIIPENLAHDAAEGAKQNAKRNPVGFLRKTLAETCSKRGIDLDRELARVRMPKGSPTSKPKRIVTDEIRAMVEGIGAIK
jgi:hypothetical protein